LSAITTKKLNFPLRLSMALYVISLLFHVMRWPLNEKLTVVSVIGLLLFYSFRFYNKPTKDFIDHIKLFFVILWSLTTINKSLHLIYLPDLYGFLPYFILFWLMMIKRVSYTNLFGELRLRNKEKAIYAIVFIIAVVGIFSGALFKIMHWPYGSILLIIGLFLFSVIIIVDYFVRDYPIDQNEIDQIGKQ